MAWSLRNCTERVDCPASDSLLWAQAVSYTHLAKNMLIRTWDGVKWSIDYYDGDCQLGSDNKSLDVYKRQGLAAVD